MVYDPITSQVARDIVASFNGMPITYNGETKIIYATRQRMTRKIASRVPFVEVAGPWIDVDERDNRCNEMDLKFAIEFIDYEIDDSDEENSQSISEISDLILAQLNVMLMLNYQRNGLALSTKIMEMGHVFSGDTQDTEFTAYMNISVKIFVNADNPDTLAAPSYS